MKQLFSLFFVISGLVSLAQNKPNIILILADDQGYGDISSHGNTKLSTPHLDQLADNGATLNSFMVSPVCSPTRASLLTGRYHIRTGVVGVSKNFDVLRSDETTVAEVFKAQGYKTACFGKWHNGYHFPNVPNGQGFDEFFGYLGGKHHNYFNATLEHNGEEVKTEGFITDVLTDKAMNWIEQHKEDPFFCYIPYNAPHTPYQVPDEYYNMFAEKGFDTKTATIYGMVKNLDDNIGRLMSKVSALELKGNTIIIFLTDNGPNTPNRFNAGMKGHKTHVDEGGVRVPFFIQREGHIPFGTKSDQLGAHIDILPTLADLCEIELPDNLSLDGISLKNHLVNPEAALTDRSIFTHFYRMGQEFTSRKGTARTLQYRYIHDYKTEQLFDLINDPGQNVNLREQKPDVFEELQTSYLNWFQEVSNNWKVESVIPVGYDEFPRCKLNAVEAKYSGDLKFHGKGYVNDWLENWINPQDSITWSVNIVSDGDYEFLLEYVCPQEDLGSTISLTEGGQSIKARVNKPFSEPFYETHDRAPRSGELQKPWGKLKLGTMSLPKGASTITLSASKMKGNQIIELKSILVKKLN
mgnify:CR=1 FL=1